MTSSQAKVSWKSPRKGENKNFRSISFPPFAKQKIPKKFKKLKKYHYAFILSQNRLDKAEEERK